MKKKQKQIFIISSVILVLVALLGVASWFILKPETKTEVVVKEELNVEWYDKTQTEFTITTAQELYEFAQLSSYYDFKGQTIKLGADIVFNDGDASEWGVMFPENIWDRPINNFAGTFDGQGHTISGIYCMGYLYQCSGAGLKPLPAGLFANTKPECVIKNFKLVNSYFCGDLQDGAGIISACGGGTFDSIYTDATLVSYKYWNGGIIGKATESTTITNCWFDGRIDIIGGYARYTGGIMGRAMNKEADFLIEHCLATGIMYNETEKTGVGMGAILGNALDSSTVTINDCFVNADLTNEYKVAVGSVYGVSENNATVKVTNTYASTESYDRMVGAVLGIEEGVPVGYPEEMLKGYGGYQWTSLDFDKYWSIVEDGTPILTTFADVTPSLKDVERYVDISWYTDEATEYVLNDKADLYGFALLSQSWDFEGKTVKLGADIVVNEGKASEWAKEAPQLEWISIGPKSKPFAGTFDGQMHTISGIYLNSDVMNTGLFSVTSETSIIKNVKLTNSYITSEASFTGSIVGQGRGTIDTVYSDATVIASKGGIGGFVGLAYGEKVLVKNCWFAGNVTNTSNNTTERGTGGIIGTVYDEASAVVLSCLNTGTIDAKAYTHNQAKTGTNVTPIVGGIVGWVRKPTSTFTASDCLNVGNVLVSDKVTGGYGSILGYSDGNTTIEHTYATAESSALTAARMKGWVIAYEKAKLTGYEGYRWTTLDFDKYWSVMEKGTPVLKSFAGKGMSINGVARMVDTSWYDAKKDTYVLTDIADLYGFAYLSYGTDFAKKTVQLGADITLNSGNAANWATTTPALVWRSIASKDRPFAGTFDGQGHTISGLYQNTDTRFGGLFADVTSTAVVKNVKLSNSYFKSTVDGSAAIAAVIGRANGGTFTGIYTDDTVIVTACGDHIGGIIGLVNGNTTVNNCWNAANITNTSTDHDGTGGIVGCRYDGKLTITHCMNSGTIDVTAYTEINNKGNVVPYAAGLVGYTNSKDTIVDDCLNTGSVLVDKANNCFGGLMGYHTASGTITNTYTTKESSTQTGTTKAAGGTSIETNKLTGYGSFAYTTLDFDKYWAVVEGGAPILKTFVGNEKVLSVAGCNNEWFLNGEGTETNPYILKEKEDLYGFQIISQIGSSVFEGKTVKLGNDITVNNGAVSEWNNPKAWTPIGKNEPFAGTFDGGLHTISGLYCNEATKHAGLFGQLAATASVKNLMIANSYFNSSATDEAKIGAVVGYSLAKELSSIYVDSTVTVSGQKNYVGGIAGMIYGAAGVTNEMNKCWSAATVENKTSGSNNSTGGLVGNVHTVSLNMTDCLNTGIVKVEGVANAPAVGGFVGRAQGPVTISKGLSLGTIRVQSGSASMTVKSYGTFVGRADKTVALTNVYMADNVNVSIGYPVQGSEVAKITTAEALKGDKAKDVLKNFDFMNNWKTVKDSTPEILFTLEKIVDMDWYIDEAANRVYKLSTPAELKGFMVLSKDHNFAGQTIKLMNDIALNDVKISELTDYSALFKWEPIGKTKAFAGIFDGNKKTISGIYCSESTRFAGLFGDIGAATIKNLTIDNSHFESTLASGNANLGAVTGRSGAATFDNVHVTSDVVVKAAGAQWVGGITGMTNGDTTMEDCVCEATIISGGAEVGGLIGMTYTGTTTITRCKSASTITKTGGNATGGLIGTTNAGSVTISQCMNAGTINTTGGVWIGGLIGRAGAATLTLTDCMNTGAMNCTGDSVIGGIVGRSNTKFTMTRVFNVGSITNTGTMTGAMVGYINAATNPTTCVDCYYAETVVGAVGTASKNTALNTSAECTVLKAEDIAAITGTTAGKMGEFFANGVNAWTHVAGSTPILTWTIPVPEDQLVDTDWYIDEAENRVYELSTRAELKGFMALSKEHNFAKQTIKLMADISLNDEKISELTDYSDLYKWEPVGKSEGSIKKAFAGTFDGNNKTISGIYCSEDSRFAGLFGDIGAATIKNLKIDNSRFESTLASGNANLGAVTGRSGAATFDNVHVTSDVVVKAAGAQWVGGITGMTNGDTTMEDCVCEATIISGGAEVGGLIGYTNAGTTTITRCKSVSSITKTAGNATGGLIGTAYAGTITISQCLNAGTITTTGGVWIGGLIGRVGGVTLTLTDCMNAGAMNCKGDSVIGGIVGRSNAKFTMTRVFNVGSITNTGTMTGAMVGYINAATNPTTCVDCYYTETVVGAVGTASKNTALNTSAECTVLKAEDIAAITGTTTGKMGEFFANGVNAWTHVAGSTPVLKWTIPISE